MAIEEKKIVKEQPKITPKKVEEKVELKAPKRASLAECLAQANKNRQLEIAEAKKKASIEEQIRKKVEAELNK